MHNDVPFPVVRAELDRIPPIRIKSTVGEPCNFCPKVEPTVQEPKEAKHQVENRRKHKFNNSENKSAEV